jgi:hypothetical protein
MPSGTSSTATSIGTRMKTRKVSEYYKLKGKRVYRSNVVDGWSEADHKVAYTEFANKRVSTVFLRLNHAFDNGPPMVFETMVFPKGSYLEEYCKRYSTWGQAEQGHWLAVWKTLDSGDLSD